MKNRFVRLLRMGLPGLVLAALAGCAAPVGPEETSAPETQVYTVGGVELALPEAEGRFTVVPHPEEGAWRGENLLGVYETVRAGARGGRPPVGQPVHPGAV